MKLARRLVTTLSPLVFLACAQPPPLELTLDRKTVAADGTSLIHITAHARDPIEGAVVQFAADGGALASSSVPLTNGSASVDLAAPLERELGKRAARTIHISAHVDVATGQALDASANASATPPTSGDPIVFVDANPPAAVAGTSGTIAIAILARRIANGSALAVSAVGADVVDASAIVNADGSASAHVNIPTAPVDATVTVTDPASHVSSSLVVRFVAAGAPLFDLTGSFAQIGPARVKLASGALTPNPQCAVAPSLVLASFVQSGLHVDAQYTTCDVTFPSVTSIVGTVGDSAPASFYAAIPVVSQSFTLASGDLGALYQPPPSIVVVGATLADPAHDALPTDETDARVVDADGDGHPGVTVQNTLGGDQYIVFRNIGTSKGAVLSSNEILGDHAGDLLASTETSVFGLGSAFLPDTKALGSVVDLARVDGRFGSLNADVNGDGTISCDELVDAASSLGLDLDVPETPFDCGADK